MDQTPVCIGMRSEAPHGSWQLHVNVPTGVSPCSAVSCMGVPEPAEPWSMGGAAVAQLMWTVRALRALGPPSRLTVRPVNTTEVEVPSESVTTRVMV